MSSDQSFISEYTKIKQDVLKGPIIKGQVYCFQNLLKTISKDELV